MPPFATFTPGTVLPHPSAGLPPAISRRSPHGHGPLALSMALARALAMVCLTTLVESSLAGASLDGPQAAKVVEAQKSNPGRPGLVDGGGGGASTSNSLGRVAELESELNGSIVLQALEGRQAVQHETNVSQGGQAELLNGTCSNTSMEEAVHAHLHNVVLIIHINYRNAAYKTAAFLRAFYGRFFDAVVLIGPAAIPELDIQSRGQYKWARYWYFAYWRLPKIIADYPNADGFLWTNDDVAINYWNLLKGNLSKLWLTNAWDNPTVMYFPFDLNGTVDPRWYGQYAAKDSFHRIAAKNASQAIDYKYQVQFHRSTSPPGAFPKRIVDLFYIPKRFAKEIAFELIPVFREYKVWSEIAIPMMFYALDYPQNWDHVLDDMVYTFNHYLNQSFDPIDYWIPTTSALHPWKLSAPGSARQLVMAFSKSDPCALQFLHQPLSALNNTM